ncbi:hypothetical protein MRX96_011795 [Rhipicephalus microplus]
MVFTQSPTIQKLKIARTSQGRTALVLCGARRMALVSRGRGCCLYSGASLMTRCHEEQAAVPSAGTVGQAKDYEIGRLVQEGVECLPQDVKTAPQQSSAMVASLQRAEVKLLQSDKEGGFVLMTKPLYDSKAEEAMRKEFQGAPSHQRN